jgi:hypothetical protein
MSKAVLFWSFSGNTKKAAEEYANAEKLTISEIKTVKKYNKLTVWIPGIMRAIGRKSDKVTTDIDITAYDKFVLFFPVWASHPAPSFNGLLDILPPGAEIELHLCSGGGNTKDAEKATSDFISAKGFKLSGYYDLKA